MTKAKKGLIITLFAAMMVFAFGATTVFALPQDPGFKDATATWTGYDKVTVAGCTGDKAVYNRTYDTEKAFDTTNGDVDVQVKDPHIGGVDIDVLRSSGIENISRSYFDLSCGAFAEGYGENVTPIKSTYVGYNYWKGVSGIILTAPEGTYSTTTYATAPTVFKEAYRGVVVLAEDSDWVGTIGIDPEMELSTESKDYTVSLDVNYVIADNPVETVGKIADKVVTIEGTPATPEYATMGLDEATEPLYVYYDGAEHTVVMSDLPGYTVEYTVFNSATGTWDKADPVKITDVGTVNFKVVIKNSKGEDVTPAKWKNQVQTARVYANPQIGQRLGFGFEATSSTAAYYPVEGTTYDAYSWIKAYSKDTTAKRTTAAIEANNAEFVAALKDATVIKEKVDKDDNNFRTLSVVNNPDLKADDIAALDKKYETLLKNFNISSVTNLVGFVSDSAASDADFYATATVELNSTEPITKIDHIYFTEAPAKVTYKAKALKKKAKSFSVAAVADSGNTITYKISSTSKKIKIDSATGKITVAKKTKKGTYKVKVYAQTEAGNGYAAAYTYQPMQITIKVKK